MHYLMKRFGIVLGALFFCAMVTLTVGGIPSCKTPEQNARLLKAVDLGLALAVNHEVLAPGDSLLIGQGVAILTSPDDENTKLLKLADIGLTEATKAGVINPGDTVLIKDAAQVLVTTPAIAPPAADLPRLTEGSGLGLPAP